jgi:hypothetical protein
MRRRNTLTLIKNSQASFAVRYRNHRHLSTVTNFSLISVHWSASTDKNIANFRERESSQSIKSHENQHSLSPHRLGISAVSLVHFSPNQCRCGRHPRNPTSSIKISAPCVGLPRRIPARGPTSIACGSMCQLSMPPLAPAAWPAALDGGWTATLECNVPPQRSTAGRCRHCLRQQPPRVAWGLCRHTRRGLFCQLYSQVVLFINELDRVVISAKNSISHGVYKTTTITGRLV